MYYFIREDAYCRRPRDVSGIGLDPPDYCPEGGDVRELLGCNLRFYPPEVDDLCNNPVLDHAVLSPDNKTAWLFRGKDIWHLHNLPTNPKASPSKCNVTKHSSDVTKIWQKFDTKGDALFLLESPDKNRHDLVLLHRHKYTIWDFNGGAPKVEGFIKEQPITAYGNNKGTKKQMFTEKPIVAPVEDDKRDEKSIVYQEEPFRKLCMDPTIDSADSSLDGTEIYLFKGDSYYLLTGLKMKGIGKLTKFGRSDKLLSNFVSKSAAVMTCKEGRTRGYTYEYFSKTAGKKTTTMSKSWEIETNADKPEEEFIEYTAAGFTAAFHNRNVTDPQMIVLRNDDVFYYSTVGDIFTRKRRHVKHYESAEKLPPGVTAAFSMPDQMLYLFQGNHYCYRELFYNKKPLFTPTVADREREREVWIPLKAEVISGGSFMRLFLTGIISLVKTILLPTLLK
ncbi:unnamed protein product [Medioppia subpectinata]|uniref:Uncharacterized protein n=1 Tax=Medioppia subpectinata TaxID=1979941 RepID=A0A7R9PTD4_9ACAR|nr:unnamed protein product [Medioppia subpectinata]CAG2100323.1 unnamed protein product [Medioppia subpectinata]